MKNKSMILSIAAGVVIAGGIIGWLIYGGSVPVNVDAGNGVNIKTNASMRNSVISREADGKKLWEFTVGEVENDNAKGIAYLKDIKGKVYRNDGSTLDVTAEKGSAAIKKNDFSLSGNVVATMSSGGKLNADEVTWIHKTDLITAKGKVRLEKDPYVATADEAETTSAFEKLKLKGHAKVEKGGK